MDSWGFLRERDWWNGLARKGFGPSFWGFFAAAVAFGMIFAAVEGTDTLVPAFLDDAELLGILMPRVLVALAIAALIYVILPRDRVATAVGADSGLRGLAVATVAGTITPGGGSSAYTFLSVMAVSGAERGALVAYITAWATLGLQRILIWDVPFMGAEFAILRFAISLPLPILAGLLARRLPLSLRIKEEMA